MTTILLIRHGSHDRLGRTLCGHTAGVTLNDQGRREAEALAAFIAQQGGLDAVYSSPLERARETAEPIARALGGKVEVDERLVELDFGQWNGLSFDELRADPAWDYWNRQRDHARPPDGETLLEAQVRMVRCLDELSRRHPDATVAAVSHGDLIKAALAWALGLPLNFYARFEIDPASVSRVVVGAKDVKVLGINHTLDS